MRKRYQYILSILIIVIIYELYLIFSFKYIDIQKDSIITSTEDRIVKSKEKLEEKKKYFDYINSSAYKDKIAKSSQNKKNPGEDVTFIVTKEEIDQYKKIDVNTQMFQVQEQKGPTYGMSNPQKWIYYIFKFDIRD
ncbi:MAG: hypothetical protein PHS92_01305 [Candidatus Gracilibacteria bacterium]|nr:hypothetical protein [Candidatus Gracilibacteria bacterium]